jgi:hypothetical protein
MLDLILNDIALQRGAYRPKVSKMKYYVYLERDENGCDDILVGEYKSYEEASDHSECLYFEGYESYIIGDM